MKWFVNYKILQKHYLIKQSYLNNKAIKIQSIIRRYLGKIRYIKIYNKIKIKQRDMKFKTIYQIQCFIIMLINKRSNKNKLQQNNSIYIYYIYL